MATPEDRLRLMRLRLREHQFLWGYVSQRNRNTWAMGAFFVPVSFLIFAYALTAKMQSPLLALASIFGYFAWWILYVRNNSVNRICVRRIIRIEAELMDYQPMTQTDIERRRHWLTRVNFPDWVFHLIFVVLILLWALYLLYGELAKPA